MAGVDQLDSLPCQEHSTLLTLRLDHFTRDMWKQAVGELVYKKLNVVGKGEEGLERVGRYQGEVES